MKKIISIAIATTLVLIIGIVFFINNNKVKENPNKNIENKKIVTDRVKESKDELLLSTEINGKKVDILKNSSKKDVKGVDIVELLVVDKDSGKKKIIEKFIANNYIPVEIVDFFTFKTKKDNYVIVITNSYVKVNNDMVSHDGYGKDIYIYNSKFKQVFGLEEFLYEISFDDKEETLNKLKELEKEGKL